jgi:cold shock CspA family protein
MALPLQLTFHGLRHSDALEDYVKRKAEKLPRLSERITHCRVAIEVPHRRSRTTAVRVRVALGVPPRDELVIDRHHKTQTQNDAYAAIDVAFEDAVRALREETRVRRGAVKTHENENAAHGTVEKLYAYEGYGFVRTDDGRELYFHKNSVGHDAFERMRIGSRVRVVTNEDNDGGHASYVALLKRRKGRETWSPHAT